MIDEEIDDLASHDGGWHFIAGHAELYQLQEFDLVDMAQEMRVTGSHLWAMLDVIVSSIIMQGRNQKSNWLQSMCGIFLHAMHAPQKLVDSLAHMGISIAQLTIYRSLDSLGKHILADAQKVAATLIVVYAHDNLDIEFKPSVPTIERAGETSKHFTTSMVFPLLHGTTADDLRCSQYLWERSQLNIHAPRYLIPPKPTWLDLMREPESVEKIPLAKTPILPLRATMDNNSQVAGNISALTHILSQVGVGDPRVVHADIDISEHVVLFYGDLGTGEKIEASLERRSIEGTPWLCLQFVVFMACVDALWKIFIQPGTARTDSTCLMKDVSILRPRETGTVASKPGFRRMHQIIQHAGICRRLDCWRVEAQRRDPSHTSLQLFAASKPSLDYLKAVANHLAMNCVDRKEKLHNLRSQASSVRDRQYENNLLLHEYFCLYEEITFAMNHGDIGCVESCFIPWIWIFKATGKHKYVKHRVKYLSNVPFLYPPGLKKAIRYSILINPSGKPDCFRVPDWCLELNNLYTKTKYGGVGVNYTERRIIDKSVLIQVFCDLHLTFQRNLALGHLTTRHAEPDMTLTFDALLRYLQDTKPHEIVKGRESTHSIADMKDKGQQLFSTAAAPNSDVANDEDGGVDDELRSHSKTSL
ncbi:hypothetical protein BC835DRAFT_1408708 [Cytidiella melzeri]|nr:hypothetical protein BC835DRAFT_1408708 [Cytidiella melzeri]